MRRRIGDRMYLGLWRVAPVGMVLFVLGATGCHQGMWDKGHFKPLERADQAPFFANGNTALPLTANTVPYGDPDTNDFFYTGKIDGDYSTVFPFEVTRDVLKRGQDRFNIYCAPCHSPLGDGNGMIVRREMKQAGNYHTQRLLDAQPGYFFDVMTNGFGVMYSYASRVEPKDRWAIAAYIRVLQFSQNANVADLPPDVREELMNPQPETTEATDETSHAAH